jgi:prepilin-type N-terminal cleavage/methylation domain-containing protein
MKTRLQTRGVTLIELMVSLAILAVVVTMTMSLVVAGMNVSRRGHEISDANEGARVAGEAITNALQAAGLGMSGGLYVSHVGVVVKTSPVIVINNTTGPDELWLVRPHRNALAQSCVDEGAATTVQKSGFGPTPLFVRCSGGLTAAGLSGSGAPNLLMATNMSTGALLSTPTFAASGGGQNLSYDEAAAGYADDQGRGFQKGDLVMPVRIEHYFVNAVPDTTQPDGGMPCLMMEPGVVGTVAQGFAPTSAPRVVQRGVEDIQFAVGFDSTLTGDPANITLSNASVGPPYAVGLRSLRISVMSRSQMQILDSSGKAMKLSPDLAPRTLEDHVVGAPVPDGYRRTLYTRRVELVNLASEQL